MKVKRKIIIIIIILLFLVLSILLYLLKDSKKVETDEIMQEKGTHISFYSYSDDENNDKILVVKDRNDFFTIESCINMYVNFLTQKDTESIYKLLDTSYINEFNITEQNILDYVEDLSGYLTFNAKKMYYEKVKEDFYRYYVIGEITEETGAEEEEGEIRTVDELKITVNADLETMLFSIIPRGYGIAFNQNKELVQQNIDIKEIGIKTKYNCNELMYNVMDIDNLLLKYFNNYRTNAIFNPEEAYSLLNEEYREKRFGNLDSYKRYIENNREKLYNSILEKYQIKVDDEKTRYICVDSYEDYYIFDENSVMNYSIILDAYTIDLPQFIEKYDSSNTQEKVLLNIEKVKQALNSGDYTYVYSKLAQNFKDNKYKTEQEFENYIKDTLYNYVDIEYNNFENEGETYIYNVTIKNLMNESDKEINMQIIMQLKDERDFIMSFNITE